MAERKLEQNTGPIVQVADLTYTVRGQTLLHTIGFDIAEHEAFVLLGENGSGKTLLIEAMAGDIRHQGKVSWRADVPRGRRAIAYDGFATFSMLKVGEVLKLLSALYKHPVDQRLHEVMKLAELERKAFGVLSKGERKRVGVYAALFSAPAFAILDEPTDGMDPMMRSAFWRIIEQRSGAIMLTTHMWDEAEAVHDRIALISGGRFLHPPAPAGTLKALLPFEGKIKTAALPEAARPPGQVVTRDGVSLVFFRDEAERKAVIAWLGEAGLANAGYSVLPIDLADVYHWLSEQAHGS
ncbi:ABC transporter ATP-binding protein [Hyphomonadaceae bacterium BL14]|nr:ABC transporter ATP-binding protein [Hyphomonadaceae bacterium BL14]